MAFVTKPVWTPATVGSLPETTKVAFEVVPGIMAEKGVAVEYKLRSRRGRCHAAPAHPALLPEEASSTPAPPALVPSKRQATVVVDFYPQATAERPFEVERLLRLSELSAPSPGISTLVVTVSDVTASGDLVRSFERSATISL